MHCIVFRTLKIYSVTGITADIILKIKAIFQVRRSGVFSGFLCLSCFQRTKVWKIMFFIDIEWRHMPKFQCTLILIIYIPFSRPITRSSNCSWLSWITVPIFWGTKSLCEKSRLSYEWDSSKGHNKTNKQSKVIDAAKKWGHDNAC